MKKKTSAVTKVLVVNCGSSSLKFQLFDMKGEQMLCKGLVERIGIAGSRLVYTKTGCEKIIREVPMKNHVEAIAQVMAVLTDEKVGVYLVASTTPGFESAETVKLTSLVIEANKTTNLDVKAADVKAALKANALENALFIKVKLVEE